MDLGAGRIRKVIPSALVVFQISDTCWVRVRDASAASVVGAYVQTVPYRIIMAKPFAAEKDQLHTQARPVGPVGCGSGGYRSR